jgi:small GTP-binding protein
MKKYITIGILAHVDAGKTTLSEGFLFTSGAIRKMGRVDHKDTFLDTYELERSRGITIFSKKAVFDYGDTRFTLLDTPGHADFSPEMERTLQILDMAVLIISAADGVTSQIKLLWKLLFHYKVPVLIFVNKMDQPGSDREALLTEIKTSLGSCCVPFDMDTDLPQIQEELAVCDDELLSAFLEGTKVTEDDIRNLIGSRKCFPVLFGSALKMEGVKELLDAISLYATGISEENAPAPFAARVYKISRDSGGARLTHLKVLSGSLKVRDLVGEEKIDQIRVYSGEKYEALQEAAKGMVVAVTGLSKTRSGEGLGELKSSSVSEVIQPVLSCTLILPEETDSVSFYKKLKVLEEEEPMLLINLQEPTGKIEVKVMGEVQKEILKYLIKTRFDTDVSFGPGHIIYKETIAGPVEGVGHFEPLRHYAEVHLLLEPAEPGSGIIIDNKCHTDDLALNWQRLILTHIGEKKHVGVLTGSEITDIKITLLTGRAHEKHTEGGDFRQATYRAIRQGLMMADSVLLEPMFDYSIEVPQQNVGRVLSDMQRMNASVSLPEIEGDKAVITGTVPAACLGDYVNEVASYTHGEGSLSTTLSGYAPCHNTEEVLDEYGYYPESDTENPSSSVFCSHGAGTVIAWDEVRNYMHLDTGWTKDGFSGAGTDLTDSIDMEALKKLQARSQKRSAEDRSFTEIQREMRITENELKDIFERTYGTIKPRYVESDADRKRYEAAALNERLGLNKPSDAEITLSAKKQNSKKEAVLAERMKEYLLVDGYNVIYASDSLKNLASHDLKAARDKLVDILINFQGYRREQVILVFDAYRVHGGTEHLEDHAGLKVIYTKEAETADQYIEKAAQEIGKKHRVTVATSDAIEQVIVMSSGAIRLSARDFWLEVERTNEMIRDHL